MLQHRVIPCLLLKNQGLVKTVRFSAPKYVGDPINAVKIFNDKEADELVFLDITASLEKREPPFQIIQDIANEAFMPMAFGGGIRSIEQIRRILQIGIEKVVINSYAIENRGFIRQASAEFGAQSIVVSIDVKKKLFGRYEVYSHSGTRSTGLDPAEYALEVEQYGAGEIILTSIDRDGTMSGYDAALIKLVSKSVSIPVVALGGAGSVEHFTEAVRAGAAAVAAGSFFVFHGKHRAVLITYPSKIVLRAAFTL